VKGGGRALEGKGDGAKGCPSDTTAAAGKGECDSEGPMETGNEGRSHLAGDGEETGGAPREPGREDEGEEREGDEADGTEVRVASRRTERR
jgi:hypothetical protein